MENSVNILYNHNRIIKNQRMQEQNLEKLYPLDIQFYTNTPPPITTEQLLDIVTERIYVHKVINSVIRDIGYKKFDEKCRIATERLKSIGSVGYAKLINHTGHRTSTEEDIKIRIIDHTSFVVLRLALINDVQLYESFQRIEEEFFNLRLFNLDEKGVRDLLNLYSRYPQITNNEKRELESILKNYFDDKKNYDSVELFKVPLSIILGFIDPHEIYFDKGMAFIPFNKMQSVLRGLFREHLEQQASLINTNVLIKTSAIFEQSQEFMKIFQEVHDKFKQVQQYSFADGTILASDIDGLVLTSFPPCMRAIHETFREKHHLKHESRLQYTLFLKGIGVPVDETIKLFKKEFLKKTSAEHFDKEYKYYIEHAYGFRGTKNDYQPKSCVEIQNTRTNFDDCNGCLFYSNDKIDIEDLDVKLTQWNISDNDKKEILDRTNSGNSGYACAHYFEIMNDCSLGQSVKHPNQYFKDSRYVRANGIFEYRCEYEVENVDDEKYEYSYPADILPEEESHQPVLEHNSESAIKIAKPSECKSDLITSISKNISKMQCQKTSDKIVASASAVAAKNTGTPNMLNSSSNSLNKNHQTFNNEIYKLIRKSMISFDELFGVENIRSGAVVHFTPPNNNGDDSTTSSNENAVKK